MDCIGCEKCRKAACGQCVLVSENAKHEAGRMTLVITTLEPGLIRAQLLDQEGEEWDSFLVSRIATKKGKAVYEKPQG